MLNCNNIEKNFIIFSNQICRKIFENKFLVDKTKSKVAKCVDVYSRLYELFAIK